MKALEDLAATHGEAHISDLMVFCFFLCRGFVSLHVRLQPPRFVKQPQVFFFKIVRNFISFLKKCPTFIHTFIKRTLRCQNVPSRERNKKHSQPPEDVIKPVVKNGRFSISTGFSRRISEPYDFTIHKPSCVLQHFHAC